VAPLPFPKALSWGARVGCVRRLCVSRCASALLQVASCFVYDALYTRSVVAFLGVCGMVMACMEPSPSVLDVSVQPSSGERPIDRRYGALRARARRWGAFFGAGMDEDDARLPGAFHVC
jgi:hypothetical protein